MMTLREIQDLEERFGSPLYILDESGFKENAHRFLSAMKNAYQKYCLSYSFKTNYTPYVTHMILEMGGAAEVVSKMEYDLARQVGFPPERIILNGPDKMQEMIIPLLNGSQVHADHLPEIEACALLASNYPGKNLKIGLRVNLDLGQDFISRFGIDPDDLQRAMDIVASVQNLKVAGLHCHISRCRGLGAWKKRTEIMLELADRLFDKAPDYLDLGSGMFGDMEQTLASQFSDIPSYEDYASVTASLVAAHYSNLPEKEKPVLITEPGTTLINRYISLLARVDAIKQVRGKQFAILNCSEHNLGETCVLKQLPLTVIRACEVKNEDTGMVKDLVGYTCLEQDIMYRNYPGALSEGDRVIFGNVGGYSTVYKPPFIRPNCAMIVRKQDGECKLIRRAESAESLLQTYIF